MSLSETIQLKDEVSAAADKASASLERLATNFDRVNAAAGVAAQSTASAATTTTAGEGGAAKATSDHADAIDDVAGATGDAAKAEKKLGAIKDKIDKKQSKASKIQKKANKGLLGDLGALGKATAIVGAVTVVATMVKKTVEWASETTKTKRQMKNMLDILTKGKGDRMLAGLTRLSKGLNISVDSASKSFLKFRKASLTNVQAVQMIKFKAGIESAIGPTEDTAAAVDKVMKRIVAGEDASKVIKEIAKGFRVAGDGSSAAAVKAETLDGRMKALSLRWGEFAKEAAVPIGEALLDFGDILMETGDSLTFIGKEIERAYTDWGESGVGLLSTVKGNNAELNAAWGEVSGFISDAASDVAASVSEWASAGADVVNGLIDGATSIDFAGALKSMAIDALKSVKDVFKVASASKVMAEVGVNVGAGFTKGVEKTPPPALPMPQTPALAADKPGAGASAGVGDVTIEITVNGGAEPDATAAAIRREVVSAFNQFAMSGGF